MTGPLPDVWYHRDFPVLIEIAKRIDAGKRAARDELAAELGYSASEIQAAFQALERKQLIIGMGSEETGTIIVTDVTEPAYVLTGLHPSDDDVRDLVEAILAAADRTEDVEEKSRLRTAADAVR